MKYIYLFIVPLFIVFRVSGQTAISGACVNSLGEPVEYVNIGVMDTHWGIMTNDQGHFSLNIPDSLLEKSVTFSHISYENYTIPISELIKDFSQTNNIGEEGLKVVLTDNSYSLQEVVVTASKNKKTKIINLNSKGVRIPRGSGMYEYPSTRKDDDGYRNLGVLLDLKNKTWIRQIELDIFKSTFDTLTFRVVAYRVENDIYTPIIHTPYYFNIEKSDEKQHIECNLSDFNIYEQGTIYIGIETVKVSKGMFSLPAFTMTNTYYRNMATGGEYKRPFGFGLQVKGSALK